MPIEAHWEGRLDLSRVPGTDGTYRIWKPLTFWSAEQETGFQIQPHFQTDGASVPRAFRWLAAPFAGKHAAAAVLHDALYYDGFLGKEASDLLFLEAMKCSGVSVWRRQALYQAVKWFGWPAWREHRKKDSWTDRTATAIKLINP